MAEKYDLNRVPKGKQRAKHNTAPEKSLKYKKLGIKRRPMFPGHYIIAILKNIQNLGPIGHTINE